ncbi:hypothetical protein FJTKL_01758 [Diaporthe vaccinii]|uniref:Uncharacterized protein n=1 Tax=Diaporthe vaccinii TaxID=105482 RepID=A0ABR4F468_9PEZI
MPQAQCTLVLNTGCCRRQHRLAVQVSDSAYLEPSPRLPCPKASFSLFHSISNLPIITTQHPILAHSTSIINNSSAIDNCIAHLQQVHQSTAKAQRNPPLRRSLGTGGALLQDSRAPGLWEQFRNPSLLVCQPESLRRSRRQEEPFCWLSL